MFSTSFSEYVKRKSFGGARRHTKSEFKSPALVGKSWAQWCVCNYSRDGGRGEAGSLEPIDQPALLTQRAPTSIEKKKVLKTKMEIDGRRYYMLFWLPHACVSGAHVPTYS